MRIKKRWTNTETGGLENDAEKRKNTDKEHESDRDIQTDRRALMDWSQKRLLKTF